MVTSACVRWVRFLHVTVNRPFASYDKGIHMKKTIGFWGTIIAAIALIAVGALGSQLVSRAFTPTVKMDTTTVAEQLERCQELATAKLEYRGLVKYEEGDIDFINKKGFTMIYDAEVRAGVDLSEATYTVHNGNVTEVHLPAATVQQISVDADSLEFYDEKFALFNWQDRTDTAEALKLAEEDAAAKVAESGLIEEANAQAKEVVETLLAPFAEMTGATITVTVESAGE